MGKQNRRAVVLEPEAAGIDIGAEEIYVAVPLHGPSVQNGMRIRTAGAPGVGFSVPDDTPEISLSIADFARSHPIPRIP